MNEYPAPQAVGSASFHIPPSFISGSMTLPELWDHHLNHSADHPIFVFEEQPGSGVKRTVTWGEAVRALHRAGRIISNEVARSVSVIRAEVGRPPVIGFLAITDSITAWTTITGIIRAGLTVFLISPRNSALAISHLLKETNCQMVIISEDKPTQDLFSKALKTFKEEVHAEVAVLNLPKHAELYPEEHTGFEKLPPPKTMAMNTVILISHSSGSTSFPKPRNLTNRILAQWSRIPYNGEIDMCGKVMAAHALPLFHIMGFSSLINWTSSCGIVAGVFAPTEPPTAPNPENVLEGAISSKADLLLCVPSFLEAWSKHDSSWPKLKAIDFVWFAGGPLPKHVGDFLVENGVKVRTLYGATEFGGIPTRSKDVSPKDWQYVKLTSTDVVKFVRQDGPEDLYELHIIDSPSLHPCVINSKVDDKPAYATNDLFIPHPTNKSLWRVHGRADDQIMHSTGEKTNPGPMEQIIIQNPVVKYAVMFGQAHFQAGVLIQPAEEKLFDPNDEEKLAAFRNEIWPTVQKANAYAPSHSRIFKEMIVVAHPSKPFQLTPKGTLRRTAIVRDYADEISGAYNAVEEASMKDISPPGTWDSKDSLEYVRAVANKVIGRELGDADDFFQSGADSLQATSIRNAILHAFRQKHTDTTHLGTNLVYSNPSIAALADFISKAASGDAEHDASSPAAHVQKMEEILNALTRDFPPHKGTQSRPEGEMVLITGTTGSLGSLMLARLVALPSVSRVYALNRHGKKDLKDRHLTTFEAQEIDKNVLDSPKLVLMEGDTDLPSLGLPEEAFIDLGKNVTSIIHNAWKVDFNLSLSSFEPLIRGVRRLIDFALSSPFQEPPTIVFTSSISDLQHREGTGPVPEMLNQNPLTAIGAGYGESKWVASRLLDIARSKTPLRPVIVRVGQLSGSSATGNWNPWEWFPSIVRSGTAVRCLPDVHGVVSWLPVDIAASAIVDVRNAGGAAPLVNLVHPQPVPWARVIGSLAEALRIPVIPYSEWLARLQGLADGDAGVETVRRVPALKLLDFYRAAGAGAEVKQGEEEATEAIVGVQLEVKVATSVSETLSGPGLKPLGVEDTEKWLGYWKRVGALEIQAE